MAARREEKTRESNGGPRKRRLLPLPLLDEESVLTLLEEHGVPLWQSIGGFVLLVVVMIKCACCIVALTREEGDEDLLAYVTPPCCTAEVCSDPHGCWRSTRDCVGCTACKACEDSDDDEASSEATSHEPEGVAAGNSRRMRRPSLRGRRSRRGTSA